MQHAFNPYHPAVAFDDLVGADASFGVPSAVGLPRARRSAGPVAAAQAILRRARRRSNKAPSRVIGGVIDTTVRTFGAGGITYQVIGDDAPPIDLPVYGRLYQQFTKRLPEPKLARVDDIDSYTDFRAARREPYLAKLADRVSALEAAFAAHVADHHADGRVEALEAALQKHIAECVHGGEPIELPIAECASGQIECWQDGKELLCTVRVPHPDGIRMITSGTSIATAVDEVVGCAMSEDVEPEDLLAVGPTMIQIVGAGRLVEQVSRAADEVIDCCEGGTGTVALVPSTDPALAAAMMLLQRCQRGDWAACVDARRMQRDNYDLLSNAAQRLLMAQRFAGGGMA